MVYIIKICLGVVKNTDSWPFTGERDREDLQSMGTPTSMSCEAGEHPRGISSENQRKLPSGFKGESCGTRKVSPRPESEQESLKTQDLTST